MQVPNAKFEKFIPMNFIVTYIDYVNVFEANETQKELFQSIQWSYRSAPGVSLTLSIVFSKETSVRKNEMLKEW